MSSFESVRKIVFPPGAHARLVGHARRKLRGEYLPDEEQERKAYGIGRWAPILRAFFEGRGDSETRVVVAPGTDEQGGECG